MEPRPRPGPNPVPCRKLKSVTILGTVGQHFAGQYVTGRLQPNWICIRLHAGVGHLGRRFVVRKHSTTTFIRVVGLTLIALLSLASGRSLIPGLCATQTALEDAHAATTSSCCDVPTPRTDDGVPFVRAVPSEVHCAFCNLATILVTTLSVVTFDTVSTPHPVDAVHLESLAHSDAVDNANSGRAPPVIAAV